MNLIRRYREYLAARATGLSPLGWYVVSAKEGLPWVLAVAALTIVASFVPEPNRLLAICIAFAPGFLGWMVTQIYMLRVHSKDLGRRRAVRD